MKTKSLVLGACAIVFAIGSAFTSVSNGLSVSPVFIKLKTSASQPTFTCTSIPATCSASGSNVCTIQVRLASGSVKNADAHTTNQCSANYQDQSVVVPTIYDAGVGSRPTDVTEL
jgi:hypothetical protein